MYEVGYYRVLSSVYGHVGIFLPRKRPSINVEFPGLSTRTDRPQCSIATILSGTRAHGECATFDVWVEAFGAELLFFVFLNNCEYHAVLSDLEILPDLKIHHDTMVVRI